MRNIIFFRIKEKKTKDRLESCDEEDTHDLGEVEDYGDEQKDESKAKVKPEEASDERPRKRIKSRRASYNDVLDGYDSSSPFCDIATASVRSPSPTTEQVDSPSASSESCSVSSSTESTYKPRSLSSSKGPNSLKSHSHHLNVLRNPPSPFGPPSPSDFNPFYHQYSPHNFSLPPFSPSSGFHSPSNFQLSMLNLRSPGHLQQVFRF